MAAEFGAKRGAAASTPADGWRLPLSEPGASGRLEHSDFSVVVKNRAPGQKPWRWEIYRAGRRSAIEYSAAFYETMTEANRAGKKALAQMLSEFPA
jgi:hypothetical protein